MENCRQCNTERQVSVFAYSLQRWLTCSPFQYNGHKDHMLIDSYLCTSDLR